MKLIYLTPFLTKQTYSWNSIIDSELLADSSCGTIPDSDGWFYGQLNDDNYDVTIKKVGSNRFNAVITPVDTTGCLDEYLNWSGREALYGGNFPRFMRGKLKCKNGNWKITWEPMIKCEGVEETTTEEITTTTTEEPTTTTTTAAAPAGPPSGGPPSGGPPSGGPPSGGNGNGPPSGGNAPSGSGGNTSTCSNNAYMPGSAATGTQCMSNLEQSDQNQIDNPSYVPFIHSPGDENWTIEPFFKIYKCETSNKRIIQGNGIPNHDIVIWNPSPPCEQFWQVELPLNPTYNQDPVELPRMNFNAITLGGIPIFGATEGTGDNAVLMEAVPDAAFWYGHAAQSGDWHYHSPRMGTESELTEHTSNTLVAFALDGFPIYGPLNDTETLTLDNCNGRFDADGNYQYHLKTIDQVDGTADYCDGTNVWNKWNYILGCYHGETSNTVVATTQSEWGVIPNDCVEDWRLEGLAEDTDILAFLR